MQTSAHIGARPAHQAWQGKIFSRSGTSKQYPDFVLSTGYGTGAGLMGWNCRHSFYPFFEGISENAYSQAELDSYAGKTVMYNGKEIPIYDATQMQRGIERKIRLWKRKEGAYEAAGLDNDAEAGKVKEWQSRMRDFIKQTGLQRQSVREHVLKVDKPIISKIIPAKQGFTKNSTGSHNLDSSKSVAKKDFSQVTTIEGVNNYAKNELGLRFAEYRGTDLRIANECNSRISDYFEIFPKLRKQISATGTTQERYKFLYEHYYSNYIQDSETILISKGYSKLERIEIAKEYAQKMAFTDTQNIYAFSENFSALKLNGIFINGDYSYDELLTKISEDVASGFHPIGTNSVRGIINHEFGHQINNLLGLDRNATMKIYFDSLSLDNIKNGLSEYANTDIDEFISEGWAEYLNNPNPRKIAETIGNIIMEAYNEHK